MKSVFIVARLGSKRLPNKHILKIKNKYCIEYVIERAKLVKNADNIVLATTNLPEDNILEQIALSHSINVFRGDVDDMIRRCYFAAKTFDVDFFVVAGGDNLFSEPELLDLAILQYKRTQADLITWENTGLICGSFNYGIKTKALKKIIETKKTNDTEMISVFFNKNFIIEKLENIPTIYKRDDIRATMDYVEDYEFFKKVIGLAKSNYTSLRHIINIIDQNYDVVNINGFRHKDWKKNQIKKIKSLMDGDM